MTDPADHHKLRPGRVLSNQYVAIPQGHLIEQAAIRDAVVGLVRQADELVFDNIATTVIKFVPLAWDDIAALREGVGGMRSGRMLFFEFRNNPKRLRLVLWLGPGPAETRELIFHRAQHRPFRPRRRVLSPMWSSLWSMSFLQPVDYETKVASDVLAIINERWRKFIDQELPPLVQAITSQPSLRVG